ncbi:MAG: hypothetical protein ACRDBG_09665 [Waterburya sp.]
MSYHPGVWSVICDRCGFEFKSNQVRKTWDGLYVCKDDWEKRHEQDLLRPKKEKIITDFQRPDTTEAPPVFVLACTRITKQPKADIGVADCATVSYGTPEYIGF